MRLAWTVVPLVLIAFACGEDAETGGSSSTSSTSDSATSSGSGGGSGGAGMCVDADGDGYDDDACGGEDCNDDAGGVNPDALDGARGTTIGPSYGSHSGMEVLVGGDGRVHGFQPSGSLLYHLRDGDTWTVEQVVPTQSRAPSAVFDDNGALHVVFGTSTGQQRETQYATNASGSWVVETVDGTGNTSADSTGIALTFDGRVHVCYRISYDSLYYAVRATDGMWTVSSVQPGQVGSCTLGVDPQGTLHIAYDGQIGMRYATNDGGGWLAEDVPGGGGRNPHMVVDANGDSHIVAANYTSNGDRVLYTRRSGSTWNTEVVQADVDYVTEYFNGGPTIALDNDDNPIVTYGYGKPQVLSLSARIDGVWRTMVADRSGNSGYHPAVAVAPDGHAHVLHRDFCGDEVRHVEALPPNGEDEDCDGNADQQAEVPQTCDLDATPPDINFTEVCTSGYGPFSSHVAMDRTAPELHLVGVYQGGASPVEVHLDRKTPAVLVLSSYEQVRWKVTVADGACLQKVIVTGYHEHSCVHAPEGVEVEVLTDTDALAVCGYQWPSSTGGCDTSGLVAAAEAHTGLTLASFAGCNAGESFTISD